MRWTITGTDTDVGKTVVTACLAAGARALGITVLAAKPVASGVTDGDPGSDAARIGRAAGHAPRCWCALPTPVSPHRAQEIAGLQVDLAALRAWLDAQRAPLTLVEAAGGWRVPLLTDASGVLYEVVDLARDVDGPVVVVAADRLGVLNHTRLTVQAIRSDGLTVLGVVLCRLPGGGTDASRASNLADLRHLLDVPVAPLEPLDPDDPEALRQAGVTLLQTLAPTLESDVLSS